jgi:hypothetical protein
MEINISIAMRCAGNINACPMKSAKFWDRKKYKYPLVCVEY